MCVVKTTRGNPCTYQCFPGYNYCVRHLRLAVQAGKVTGVDIEQLPQPGSRILYPSVPGGTVVVQPRATACARRAATAAKNKSNSSGSEEAERTDSSSVRNKRKRSMLEDNFKPDEDGVTRRALAGVEGFEALVGVGAAHDYVSEVYKSQGLDERNSALYTYSASM
jgi:hypothetical protein